MDHFAGLGQVLDEPVQAPHQVIGDEVKTTALGLKLHEGEEKRDWYLPIDDHCSVLVLSALPHFLEKEVVNLRVPVHQRHQILQSASHYFFMELQICFLESVE